MLKKELIYACFCSVFGALLVCSNLICQKFFQWDFFGLYTFEMSVGTISYPITFLITDLISELYGKEKADRAVIAGLVACSVTVIVVMVADLVPQTSWSPISNETFHNVFQVYQIALLASLIAALVSQFIDIRIFHYCKTLTNGKHLWLRNNFSTITSQLIDTMIVNLALGSAGILKWEFLASIIVSSFVCKTIIALLDTPFFYLGVFLFKKYVKDEFVV